jgi:hypothetical protein
MDIEVTRYEDEYGNIYETLRIDGVQQFKVGPLDLEDPNEVTCEKLGEIIDRAWEEGTKGEPCVPIFVYEPGPRDPRFDSSDFAA